MPADQPRIGYLLKMYPRFSETFVVTELLALQDRGADLEIFSLRAPVDGRFHAALARVRAEVSYVPVLSRSTDLWACLRSARDAGMNVAGTLPDLLRESAADAYQAVVLAGWLRERRITHLHAHFASVAATVARLAARLAGITWSMTLHAKDIFHEAVDPDDLSRKLAGADLAVTVSDYNLAHLRRTFGSATTGTLTRIHNGLDLAAFPYEPPVDRPPVVVGVGRLVEKKGFADLIDAVALLRARGREIRLELVGGGALAQDLAERVRRLGLTAAIRLTGPLTQDETRDVVRRAAVLAAPCLIGADGNRDGLPTVVLESLALGTPVVATPVTGLPEAVQDGRTGLLVGERDVVALADALARLLDDPALGLRLARAGRDLVERRFDTRRNVARLHDRMLGVVGGRPPAEPARAVEMVGAVA